VAKTINFGVMYGMSAFRLARELGIPNKQAQGFIDAYFANYSGIRRFIDETVRRAEVEGGVRTYLGRFRPIPQITSRNRTEKQAAERVAVNTPIQGTAADIVKLAMLRVDQRLKAEGLASRMVLQVHDELILEVPEAERDRVVALLRDEMPLAIKLNVPLRVSVEWGTSWGVMH
jgi:DNA polymerase-1